LGADPQASRQATVQLSCLTRRRPLLETRPDDNSATTKTTAEVTLLPPPVSLTPTQSFGAALPRWLASTMSQSWRTDPDGTSDL